MAAPPASAPDVTLLFGPMLIGVLLNTMLYGAMAVQVHTASHESPPHNPIATQAFLYYGRYRNDRPWFRYLVLYLVIIETANWVCDVGIIYEPLILRYGQPRALVMSPILLRTDAVLTVLVSTPVQLFIAWRVRVVTRAYILPTMIFILAMVSFGGGIATTTIVTLHPDFASFGHFRAEVITWLVSSTACDVVLTASLVYSLWTRKTNMISTDSYINKIIRLSVQTGFITAAAALLDMVLYLTLPNSSVNFIFDFALSKLYTNALISTLNARPWQEHVSEHGAPNALFEQSNTGVTSLGGAQSTSFTLVQRRSSQPRGPKTYTLNQPYPLPHPPKARLDSAEYDDSV
ncbi:hypothetical protein K438DRAFT_1986533 [Mycena galopus ATCC 62051]|nr:hypothetical protein K438DRAFT_1986533 [Mycena galopus ATCC 62051]